MIKIGDKVKFLNDIGGGTVTSFVHKNMVNVENEDGFEIPYPISQLVNLSQFRREEESGVPETQQIQEQITPQPEKQSKPAEGKIVVGKDAADFYFCFVPDDAKNPLADETTLFLVNDSNFTVLFHYSHFNGQTYESVKYGTVESNSRIELESIVEDDLRDLPEFTFQLIYFSEKEKELQTPLVKKFKVSPVKFYKEKSFQANSFFKTNALVLKISNNILTTELDNLTKNDFKKVIREKESKPVVKKSVKTHTSELVQIDLHIQELIDNSTGLSNRDILGIQMDKVESEMRTAIQSGVQRIVFIHGVGQGVLKAEVAKLLKSKFSKYYFQDASFKEYGYGATMVILRKK